MNIQPTKLYHQLVDLGSAVVKATDNKINWGGCGVYAAALAKRLEYQFDNVACEIVVSHGYHDSFSDVPIQDIKENLILSYGIECVEVGSYWCNYGIDFAHIGVRVIVDDTVLMVDAEDVSYGQVWFGVSPTYVAHPGALDVESVEKLVSRGDNWNHVFPRDLIPEVHSLVNNWNLTC